LNRQSHVSKFDLFKLQDDKYEGAAEFAFRDHIILAIKRVKVTIPLIIPRNWRRRFKMGGRIYMWWLKIWLIHHLTALNC